MGFPLITSSSETAGSRHWGSGSCWPPVPGGHVLSMCRDPGQRIQAGIVVRALCCGSRLHNFPDTKRLAGPESGKAPRPAGRLAHHRGLVFALNLSPAGCQGVYRRELPAHNGEMALRFVSRWILLYAAGLYPRDGLSRGGAMSDAMDFLYSLKGETTWLINGVPLETSFGKAEYTCIAADTAPYWEHSYHRRIHLRERRSAFNALRSTVGRRHLGGRFISNAVGPFYLRSTKRFHGQGAALYPTPSSSFAWEFCFHIRLYRGLPAG